MPKALDLYSKVEDLLGVNEVTPKLYENYFYTLQTLEFDSLLDVGCGRGEFLRQLSNLFPYIELMGIDLSPLMVKTTQSKGIKAQCIDLCKLDKKFQVITAVFDMVNYLDTKALKRFMRCIEDRLEDGGYFICDINSLYAFEELAVGSYVRDDDTRFVTIDSYFEDNKYYSEFTLFEKDNKRFKKSQNTIIQYYHKIEELTKLTNLKLIEKFPFSIYGEEVEKFYLVFEK
ncbi:MAG TPA: class I SAM-dependent methyltransferase [Campylobacterales bacterium]|nr:class I SAM-dependent methyltransferase [Campylobacterales bacterium]